MNKQTLNYHTRLHDWYRQHCIQQEKPTQPTKQLLQSSSPQIAQQYQNALSGKKHHQSNVNDVTKQGTLTSDKMHSIDDWCTDVNRSLFCVKKKESSPLFRKCRLSASTKSAMSTTKTTDPRRVKSAEVFTRTGHWAKQHKPSLKGGELLQKQRGASEKDVRITRHNNNTAATAFDSNYNKLEFCVRNSTENKASPYEISFPRVNHNSLNIRNGAVIHQHKQQSDKIVDKSVVLSSQFIPDALRSTTTAKTPSDVSKGHRVKTVTVNYVVNNLVKDSNEKNGKTESHHHIEMERAKNVKNAEESKKSNRIFSASQKSVKTEINSSALGGDEESKAVLNAVVKFCEQDVVPTFCNACSGIYSGNAPPPPTPATCANCVHGISLQGKSDIHGMSTQGPSHAQIQKELAQKLVKNEKIYGQRITSAKIDIKQSEARLTEDSLHYSAERDMVRNVEKKPGFSVPNPFDDLGDDRNISFQDDDDCSLTESNGKFSGSNASMSSPRGEDNINELINERENNVKMAETEIFIQKYSPDNLTDSENVNDSDDDDNDETIRGQDLLSTSQDANNSKVQRELCERRGSRRLSMSFSYKPEVSNISTSNNLLRVLSIDDCKMGMRYNPHKVLEEHQVTDNPMADLAKQAMGQFGSELDEVEEDSQVAMRLSKNSSITSLKSSSAKDATIANKMQYKILFGPQDLNQFRNLRPKSACLTKAFKTMIHDRTIMQRLDQPGSSDKAKNVCGIAKTIEGPKYRIINTALKREIGNIATAQKQKLLRKYEQQKMGAVNGSVKNRSSSRLSDSTMEKSLSLDSLPSVKKGILKTTAE